MKKFKKRAWWLFLISGLMTGCNFYVEDFKYSSVDEDIENITKPDINLHVKMPKGTGYEAHN